MNPENLYSRIEEMSSSLRMLLDRGLISSETYFNEYQKIVDAVYAGAGVKFPPLVRRPSVPEPEVEKVLTRLESVE